MHEQQLPIPAASTDSSSPWRMELLEWCDEFRGFLAENWSDQTADLMFERLESFSALAELMADRAVSDATAGLEVYLCAFVDSEQLPNGRQRDHLRELTGELQSSIHHEENVADESEVEAQSVDTPLFQVLYVRPDTAVHADLLAALDQERAAIVEVSSVEAAQAAIEHEIPDAVILQAQFVSSRQEIAQSVRRRGVGNLHRVVWATTQNQDNLRQRLHARRAGIDLLLEDDPDDATRELIAALLQRRDEAYHVLVVEDDRGHAAYCEALLRLQGFEIDIAPSAEAALEILQSRVPDLILLDINLPDMSGIELAQLVRERGSLGYVPIVFLTGEEDLDRRAEAIAVGGDDFLSKPVRPRHLLANVNGRIGRARALAQSTQLEDGMAHRLDRVRFVEALERLREENAGCAGVVAFVLDDVADVASSLGFVRAGSLALQFSQAIEAECGGIGNSCGIGEFSRLTLINENSESALRNRVELLRKRLSERGWLSITSPVNIDFSAGIARFDSSSIDCDTVIATAIGIAHEARQKSDGLIGFQHLR